jgi:outer membrane protein
MRLVKVFSVLTTGFALMAVATTAMAAADIKIAVVDLQKALTGVDAGRKAKSSLEKEFNEKKKQLQGEEESIKKMSEDFKKQSLVLSDEAKAKKQGEIQERLMKYRELFGKSQMEIQNRERQLTEPIITKLKGIVEDLGTQNGYTIILEKNDTNVLFSQKKDDLTEEVIKIFNKKNG